MECSTAPMKMASHVLKRLASTKKLLPCNKRGECFTGTKRGKLSTSDQALLRFDYNNRAIVTLFHT